MKHVFVATVVVLAGFATFAEYSFEEQPGKLVLLRDGKPWLSTFTGPYDPARREETYKVFTHIYDFDGAKPITKGPGGKYSHHRGMFIGWKRTTLGGQTYNPWECPNAYQQHEGWISREAGAEKAVQAEKVGWYANDETPLVKETRTITAAPGENGLRVFDFRSVLTTPDGVDKVELRGDPQHAGMHVRMANEVVGHQETTEYIIPEGAEEEVNVQVPDVWWTCCSTVVDGKRWWVLHMTHPSLPTGVPTYSVRKYARFGAFFEPDLTAGKPLDLRFRIVVSENPLDRQACEKLYEAYAAE